jgi:hypothetical protein
MNGIGDTELAYPGVRAELRGRRSVLLLGDTLVAPSGFYEAVTQSDGQFVTYGNVSTGASEVVWATGIDECRPTPRRRMRPVTHSSAWRQTNCTVR